MIRHGHKIPSTTGASATKAAAAAADGSPPQSFITPIQFGADPTGTTDSTAAFSKAMQLLLDGSGQANHSMADGIVNLGGATLDLQGGEYLISMPLVIPPLFGNVRIRGGTLRAAPSFPTARFLIEVGEIGCNAKESQGVCNEFIGLDSMLLDASHVAAGGVRVAATMGTTVGPSMFFIHFNQAGLQVMGGHETILTESWMAEDYWDEKVAPPNPHHRPPHLPFFPSRHVLVHTVVRPLTEKMAACV